MKRIIRKVFILILLVIMISAAAEYIVKFIIKATNQSTNQALVENKANTNDKNEDVSSIEQNSSSNINNNADECNVLNNNVTDTVKEIDTEEQLNVVINKFMEFINNKKFQEAYNLLHSDYRDVYFPDINKFIDYCSKNFVSKSEKMVEILDSSLVEADIFVCKVRVLDCASEFGEQKEEYSTEDTFTVYFNHEEDKCKIAFQGFISSESVESSAKVGKLNLSVTKIIRYNNKVELLLKVFNGENQAVTLIDKATDNVRQDITIYNTMFSDEVGEGLYIDNKLLKISNYSIASNSSEKFSLLFNVYYASDIKRVKFSNIRLGHEMKMAEIILSIT